MTSERAVLIACTCTGWKSCWACPSGAGSEPEWWWGYRSLLVVTTSWLLLLQRQLRCSSADHGAHSLRTIAHVSVHPFPSEGARFRIAAGLELGESSVTGCMAGLERALHAPRA